MKCADLESSMKVKINGSLEICENQNGYYKFIGFQMFLTIRSCKYSERLNTNIQILDTFKNWTNLCPELECFD
jgi:hypothetical protein